MAEYVGRRNRKRPVLDLDTVRRLDFADRIPRRKRAQYSETIDGIRYDYLWSPLREAQRLMVLFCGYTARDKFPGPAFKRWSWTHRLDANCLCISDPALTQDPKISLAWYAGGRTFDPLPHIIERTMEFAERLAIPPARVWAYGSSGGGFAALRAAVLEPRLAAVAINPQTAIPKYANPVADRYLRTFWDGANRDQAMADHATRLTLTAHADVLAQRRLIIAQNDADTHHVTTHFEPLCQAMGMSADEGQTGGVRRIRFEDARGHSAAENGPVFRRIRAAIEDVEAEAEQPAGGAI